MLFNGETKDKNLQNRICNMEMFEHCRHACIMPTAETLDSIMFTVSKAETEHAEKIEHIAILWLVPQDRDSLIQPVHFIAAGWGRP